MNEYLTVHEIQLKIVRKFPAQAVRLLAENQENAGLQVY